LTLPSLLTMIIGTWFPALPSSSSTVMIRSECCVPHAAEWKIVGRLDFTQASPCATEPSCMSFWRSGVIHTKFGVVDVLWRSVTSCV